MKTIHINSHNFKQNPKEICLGNGFRKTFESLRDAKKFVADTNRFLTECLVILNFLYADAFRLHRSLWFTACNNKMGTRTNYQDVQQRTKSMLQAADEMFEKFNHSHYGSNDPYFSFIDLKKACLFLSEALEHMENTNRKRNLTADMYACMILRKRCILVERALCAYPEI